MPDNNPSDRCSYPGAARSTWRSFIPSFLLPAEALSEKPSSLHLFCLEGLFLGVSTAFVHTFLPLYVLAFGATASDLGLLSAVSHSVAPITFIVGASLAERTVHHKRLYVVLEGLLGRSMLFVFVLVPFFFQGRAAVSAIIVLQVARMTLFRLADPAHTVVTGQVVPEFIRGRFMSSRSLATSLGQLGIQPLAAIIIARYLFPQGYQYSFMLAGAAGLIGALAFARIPVPPLRCQSRGANAPKRGAWREALVDRRFVAFLLVVLAWSFGDQVTFSFYSVHMVRNLGLDASQVGFLATATSLASLVGLPLLGLLSDRRSHRTALVAAGLLLVLVRLAWLWARTPWQLLPLHLLTGLAYSGFQVVLRNLLLAIARPERYARYGAFQSAVGTTMSVVAPLLGAHLFEHVGFASNVLLAATAGAIAMIITWRYVHDRSPVLRPMQTDSIA
jgi:MFS family permease